MSFDTSVIDFRDKIGETALAHAAFDGNDKLVKLLLESGASHRISSEGYSDHSAHCNGYTPLHWVCSKPTLLNTQKGMSCLLELISGGAWLTVLSSRLKSPLDVLLSKATSTTVSNIFKEIMETELISKGSRAPLNSNLVVIDALNGVLTKLRLGDIDFSKVLNIINSLPEDKVTDLITGLTEENLNTLVGCSRSQSVFSHTVLDALLQREEFLTPNNLKKLVLKFKDGHDYSVINRLNPTNLNNLVRINHRIIGDNLLSFVAFNAGNLDPQNLKAVTRLIVLNQVSNIYSLAHLRELKANMDNNFRSRVFCCFYEWGINKSMRKLNKVIKQRGRADARAVPEAASANQN